MSDDRSSMWQSEELQLNRLYLTPDQNIRKGTESQNQSIPRRTRLLKQRLTWFLHMEVIFESVSCALK